MSINSYVITAFLQADKDNHVVGIPVNISQQNQDSMSNQVGGISLDYRYSDKKTFEENAREVHKNIYRKLKSCFFFRWQYLMRGILLGYQPWRRN